MNRYPHNIETLALVKNKTAAERVALCLRDAGVATHQYWVEDHFSFAEQLAQQAWDLVVLDMSSGNQHVPSCILRYPETPFVAISDKHKSTISDELLELGITDVASFDTPSRLKHTLQRALREAQLKREHLEMEKQSKEQDHLLRTLLNTTDEAIAYIHQGVHSFVNPAYIRLFGLADSANAIATPVLDLVAKKYQKSLHGILREFQHDKQNQAELDTHLCRTDGVLVAARLHMSMARFEGESVVQIIARPAKKPAMTSTSGGGGNDRMISRLSGKLAEPTAGIESWASRMAQLLEKSQLRINLHSLKLAVPDRFERHQLSLELLPHSSSFNSLEKMLSETRRLGLLAGLDEWLIYNAASALAKQLATNPATRYYVMLQGDYDHLDQFANWLDSVIQKFDLPANSLNLVLDGGGLSDNHRLNQRMLKALKKLPIEVGISGIEPGAEITGTETLSISDQTLGFELIDSLPIDFALLDSELCNNNEVYLQRLLKKCEMASVAALLESNNRHKRQTTGYLHVAAQTPPLKKSSPRANAQASLRGINDNVLDLTVALS